jgi:mono/diheme cytochrome c family protein
MQEPVSTTKNESIVYGPGEESQAAPGGRSGPSGNPVGNGRGVLPSPVLVLPFVRRGEGEARLPSLEDIRKYGSVGAAEGVLHARGTLRAPLAKGDVLTDRTAVYGCGKEKGDCMVMDKHSLTLAVLIVALSAFTLGCTAHAQPSKTETTLANVAKDLVIPVEAEHKKNPVPDTEEAVRQGRLLFAQSCAVCHGTDGRGGTDLGRNMYPPAMDMTSPHVQHWSDAELLWIIQNGVRLTGMPSWQSNLSETDSWKLARFIHNLPRLNAATAAPATPPQTQRTSEPAEAELIKYGKTLYKQEGCFMCHQLNGEGGAVGPDLTVEGTRDRTNEWLIGHLKDPSAYVPGSVMPAFKNLTAEQLQALTAFLQNQQGERR